MKAPYNNNLPTQTSDVIVNPENPVNLDSKPVAVARIISNEDKIDGIRFGRRWVL
jgi:hypothetical protein